MFIPWLYIHVFVLLQFSLASCAIHGNETDRIALLHFKSKITDDPFGTLSSWNNSVHFCKWYGVTCGRRHQRVTKLVLEHRKLTGAISPYIGNLSFLRELYLTNNSFNSQIPPQIGGLRRLQVLQLSNNSIGGQIPPNISACSNLIHFVAELNELEGDIPEGLALLRKLESLNLPLNFISGTIPSSLGNMSSLGILSLGANNIVGSIPNTLGKLKSLEKFAVGANHLTGTIPPSMFNLSRLQIFWVQSNEIRGSLPWDFGITLPNLQKMLFYSNQFTGFLPATLSNASNLILFDISDNKLVGKVPFLEKLQQLVWFSVFENHLGSGGNGDLNFLCSMTNATALTRVYLYGNNYGGVLPECTGNMSTTLAVFQIGGNRLRGSIPSSIGNLVGLEHLELTLNRFTGVIPPSMGKLSKLKVLYLSRNKLSGSIPSTFGNLTMLLEMHLSHNYLSGNIPPTLASCKNLLVLVLQYNNLIGSIPTQVMTISSLLRIYLFNNHLTGTLSEEIGNIKNLEHFYVSDNMLDGKIPSSLGKCTSLEHLYIKGNCFQGNIPSSLSSLRGLVYIDLSQNNLSEEIPTFLENFTLEYLNLSYNNLEGAVPTGGIFKNATATSVMGNKRLCGGIPQFHLHPCELSTTKKRSRQLSVKFLVSITSGVLGTIFIIYFLICCTKRKRQEPVSTVLDNSLLRFSYQDLHHATNGFSPANLIGVGGFGSVYKGTLDQGTTFVAVKVLNLQHQKAFKSFLTECAVLRNIRHRNLLKVLSACSSIDYQGNDFLALVYEFMVNGNLDNWLHPDHQSAEEGNVEPRRLSFFQRLNIAIDVACALEYLHNDCETPIVHCDLKPCNVLLDAELTGHVGDFGLVRLLHLSTQDASTPQSSSLGVKGTVGYTAPEYGMGSEVTTKGDVYSYGILLLEMFTGKRPSDDIFNEEMNLHQFAKSALPDRAFEILDPSLVQEMDEEEACRIGNRRKATILDCLVSIFEVGINCSLESPAQRMQISDFVAQLRSAKNKLSQQ